MKIKEYQNTEKLLKKHIVITLLIILVIWFLNGLTVKNEVIAGISSIVSIAICIIVFSINSKSIACPNCGKELKKEMLEEDNRCISYYCKSCNTKYISTVRPA